MRFKLVIDESEESYCYICGINKKEARKFGIPCKEKRHIWTKEGKQ